METSAKVEAAKVYIEQKFARLKQEHAQKLKEMENLDR